MSLQAKFNYLKALNHKESQEEMTCEMDEKYVIGTIDALNNYGMEFMLELTDVNMLPAEKWTTAQRNGRINALLIEPSTIDGQGALLEELQALTNEEIFNKLTLLHIVRFKRAIVDGLNPPIVPTLV